MTDPVVTQIEAAAAPSLIAAARRLSIGWRPTSALIHCSGR